MRRLGIITEWQGCLHLMDWTIHCMQCSIEFCFQVLWLSKYFFVEGVFLLENIMNLSIGFIKPVFVLPGCESCYFRSLLEKTNETNETQGLCSPHACSLVLYSCSSNLTYYWNFSSSLKSLSTCSFFIKGHFLFGRDLMDSQNLALTSLWFVPR